MIRDDLGDSYKAYVQFCLIIFTCFVHLSIINYRRFFLEALVTSVFRIIQNIQTNYIVLVSHCNTKIQTLHSCWWKRHVQLEGSTRTIRQNKTRKLQYASKRLSAEDNTGLSTFLPLQTRSRQYPLFCTLSGAAEKRKKSQPAIYILIYIDESDTLYDAKESYNHALDILSININKQHSCGQHT